MAFLGKSIFTAVQAEPSWTPRPVEASELCHFLQDHFGVEPGAQGPRGRLGPVGAVPLKDGNHCQMSKASEDAHVPMGFDGDLLGFNGIILW